MTIKVPELYGLSRGKILAWEKDVIFVSLYLDASMFDVFKAWLDTKATLTSEEMELIRSVSIIKKIRKHQFLLQEGDLWRYHAFVCAGCLRRYRNHISYHLGQLRLLPPHIIS